MKMLVTGASSFVGAHFCSLAARRRMDVIGLWRSTPLALAGVRSLQGDASLISPPPGLDVVVHLAAKVMADDAPAQNRRMMDNILSWGKPVIYGSSTVVHWPRQNAYARSRIEDEERLRKSGLPYLIVRPCAPYGPWHPEHSPTHRESMQTLAAMVTHLPVVPLIGSG
ncbi:MAG TPA: NAD(P)-dependent oxidoreductase, partial [Myxococcota bacterium]|nr:NAD(P)-dependent oxidoreductase [Myxococcota bacterium]